MYPGACKHSFDRCRRRFGACCRRLDGLTSSGSWACPVCVAANVNAIMSRNRPCIGKSLSIVKKVFCTTHSLHDGPTRTVSPKKGSSQEGRSLLFAFMCPARTSAFCHVARKQTTNATLALTLQPNTRVINFCVSLFVTLQAERENDSLVQAQGKKEEDALAAAIESFQQEFKTDLQAVKAGGGPYQV